MSFYEKSVLEKVVRRFNEDPVLGIRIDTFEVYDGSDISRTAQLHIQQIAGKSSGQVIPMNHFGRRRRISMEKRLKALSENLDPAERFPFEVTFW